MTTMSGSDKTGSETLTQAVAEAERSIQTVSALWQNPSEYIEQGEV